LKREENKRLAIVASYKNTWVKKINSEFFIQNFFLKKNEEKIWNLTGGKSRKQVFSQKSKAL